MIIFIYLFMLIILAGMAWVVIANLFPPKYNGLLWINPKHIDKMSNIETVICIKRTPEGQKPFYFRYDWWRWKNHPLYLWYEDDPVTESKTIDGKQFTVTKYPIKHWNPDTPADYKLDKSKTIPYVTPTELYDNTDWECVKRLITVKSPIGEAIKLGMAAVLVIVCVVAIVMLVSEVNSPKQAADIITTLGGLI